MINWLPWRDIDLGNELAYAQASWRARSPRVLPDINVYQSSSESLLEELFVEPVHE